MSTMDYLAHFFPFKKPDLVKRGVESIWNISNDSYMLTDDQKPLRLCKHCMKAFVASRPSMVFCSPQCKNQYNVYKSRAKNKERQE